MWREKPYGLLLTDCHMPNMDGYQLTEAVREEEKQKGTRIPIIALTANAMVGEAERCLAMGMDDYLAKPVTLQTMGERLQLWLGGDPSEVGEAPGGGSAPRARDSASPIDLGIIEEVIGSADPEMVSGMLAVFKQSFVTLRGQMSQAVEAQDTAALRVSAHSAKGAAGIAGAVQLQEALQALEEAADRADWSAIPDCWREVDALGEAVVAHVEQYHVP